MLSCRPQGDFAWQLHCPRDQVSPPRPGRGAPTGSRNSLSVSGAQLRTEICVHGEAVTAVSLAIICQHTRLPRKVCVRGDDL